MPPTLPHDCDLRQGRGTMPAVDRQGQRRADADIVERLALVVGGGNQARKFQSLSCTVILSPSAPTNSSRADGGRPRNSIAARSLLIASRAKWPVSDGQDPDYPVKNKAGPHGSSRDALALDRLAGLVADQLEGAGAENVFLVPVRNPYRGSLSCRSRYTGRASAGQTGAGREFETEDDRQPDPASRSCRPLW